MNNLDTRLLQEATRLTRAGNPAEATALIQAALQGNGVPGALDDTAERVPKAPYEVLTSAAPSQRATGQPQPGTFSAGVLEESGPELHYKLYSPATPAAPLAPLLLMLHGCTQDADDFASGTSMNTVAEQVGMYVLYPTQSQQANMNRCWNWFEPAHQRRGQGEPHRLAVLTRQILEAHPIDPRRIFVAGLSAGGAMALVLGEQYPDLFSAVGVHSGLPTGVASNVAEAMSAMRGAADSGGLNLSGNPSAGITLPFRGFSPLNGQPAPEPHGTSNSLPLIVCHGEQDRTVNPVNAERIISNWLTQRTDNTDELVRKQRSATGPDGRPYTVHTRAANGIPVCEYWQLSKASHQWSGGTPAGSHTDPGGPDVSAAMAAFFLKQGSPAV